MKTGVGDVIVIVTGPREASGGKGRGVTMLGAATGVSESATKFCRDASAACRYVAIGLADDSP